jgi:hypothetical protein
MTDHVEEISETDRVDVHLRQKMLNGLEFAYYFAELPPLGRISHTRLNHPMCQSTHLAGSEETAAAAELIQRGRRLVSGCQHSHCWHSVECDRAM